MTILDKIVFCCGDMVTVVTPDSNPLGCKAEGVTT